MSELKAAGAAVSKPIEPGDVVTLRSGGPRMTVGNVQDGKVTVCWFNEDTGTVNACTVDESALFHYAPSAPTPGVPTPGAFPLTGR